MNSGGSLWLLYFTRLSFINTHFSGNTALYVLTFSSVNPIYCFLFLNGCLNYLCSSNCPRKVQNKPIHILTPIHTHLLGLVLFWIGIPFNYFGEKSTFYIYYSNSGNWHIPYQVLNFTPQCFVVFSVFRSLHVLFTLYLFFWCYYKLFFKISCSFSVVADIRK